MKAIFTMSTGENPAVAGWVAAQMAHPLEHWGRFNSLLFRDARGEVLVALVYNNLAHPNIAMHVAARKGALWCKAEILYHIFAYPFEDLQCARVTAPVLSNNMRSRKLVESLGYTLEGTLRRAAPDGSDWLLYGMLKEECRWLKGRANV